MPVAEMRIAFHAPLKPPTHPTPSGDRKMARLLMAALMQAGHDVRLATELRTYTRTPDAASLADLRVAAAAEIERICREAEEGGFRPGLWFTYHLYYKAPDLVGPAVARRLGIPYVAAEASWSARRVSDEWAVWQEAAEEGLRLAETIFCYSARDRQGLAKAPVLSARLIDLKPFLDHGPFRPNKTRRADAETRLLAVAMMRPDNKRESYLLLADALLRITNLDWHLTIIGDGVARAEIETAFAALPSGRVRFLGLSDEETVAQAMAESDLFVWPGVREAYGLVFLEAAAQGLPALAFDDGGVCEVVRNGETGMLILPAGDRAAMAKAYAEALAGLIADPARRAALGQSALRFARNERDMDGAARILADGLSHATLLGGAT
ncbi:MAG: glycosyltransferase family 4 protein [Beijerinckiaceae bacterium]